jgi:hypothetical protein
LIQRSLRKTYRHWIEITKAIQQLHEMGQSLWLDNITRGLLTSGMLRRYIQEFSITGLTSNPTIFAFTGDEVLTMPPERLPKVWPSGALPRVDLEAFNRLFADCCHKTAIVRQDETLGVAGDTCQLLHAWRPTAPPDDGGGHVRGHVRGHAGREVYDGLAE